MGIKFYQGGLDASGSFGGGMHLESGTVILSLCSFEACAAGIAGAIWIAEEGSLTLYSTSFVGNHDLLMSDLTADLRQYSTGEEESTLVVEKGCGEHSGWSGSPGVGEDLKVRKGNIFASINN